MFSLELIAKTASRAFSNADASAFSGQIRQVAGQIFCRGPREKSSECTDSVPGRCQKSGERLWSENDAEKYTSQPEAAEKLPILERRPFCLRLWSLKRALAP